LKDDEITRQLEAVTAAIVDLRRRLPGFSASDINAWCGQFRTLSDRLKLAAAARRSLLSKAGTGDTAALKAAITVVPHDVRASIEDAEKRLKAASFNLRRELRSLSYFAKRHLSHLDGILSAIGEASGLKATYRPGRPPLEGNLGIVDATA